MRFCRAAPKTPTAVAQNTQTARAHYTNGARNSVMKLEDHWHQLRLNASRRNGQGVTVLSFTGYGGPGWVRVFSRVVMAPESQFENGERVAKVIADGVRGWRNFMSAPVPFATVSVQISGNTFELTADRGGVVDAVITLPNSVKPLAAGRQHITLFAQGAQPTSAEVVIIGEETTSGVISDIDDTVVVTKLPRPFLAAWNSFVLDEHARNPTPGMAVLMERLLTESPGSPVMYLSTGAWNVAQTLSRFLSRNLYPQGPLLLTDWGPTQDRWFRSGSEHKVQQLERLAAEFPHIKWTLIGDDGQHDPQIYADFVQRHPQSVQAVIIRELTYSEAVLAGGRAARPHEKDLGAAADRKGNMQTVGQRQIPWIFGPDGKDIADQLGLS